jgi:hypothetical protein
MLVLLAGLNVLRVINEPTAAAAAYGLITKILKEKNILIFTVAVVHSTHATVLTVVAPLKVQTWGTAI